MKLRPWLWTLFFVLEIGLPLLAFGEDSPDPTTAAIQKVIACQWAAFADNDAPKALSFAVPEIRQRFDEPEGFLLMVEMKYPAVFRHVAFRFLDLHVGETLSFQWVRLTDSSGSVWLVLYQLHREEDGKWRIGGVLQYPGEKVPDLLPSPDGA